ncbi:uncharacterized protein LOC111615508 [Centruroides sculpturatus]|uniref:uncharacterized protein LOC111615508 n=1 Tax=Centruroides sculpturatus TaxID=218467 RepID=UPI000C6EEFC6|nr:uncharacterized protein LOC111615508 [Centruroides sculpturatus]
MVKELETKILWMPKRDVAVIKNKINYCLGAEITDFEEIRRIYDYYEEQYNNLKCRVKFPQRLEDYKEKLIHRWCKQDLEKDQAWLSMKDTKMFSTCSKLSDKEVRVNSFSFCTVVGLNNLVEHYNTSLQNAALSLEYKVTQIIADFEHDRKRIFVYFIVTKKKLGKQEQNASTHVLHRFEIKYSDIYRILINKLPTEKTLSLCLYLTYPVLLYRVSRNAIQESRHKNKEENFYLNYHNKDPNTHFFIRVSKFSHCSESDIGLSSVLKLELFWDQSWDVICRLVNNCKDVDCFFSPLNKYDKPKSYPTPKILNGNFNCVYALKCIVSRTRDVAVQMYLYKQIESVNGKLNEFDNPNILEMTLIEINAAFERNNIVIFQNALNFLFEKYKDFDDEANGNSPNLVKVRRAILTPTRVIYLPSQYYFRCRFFRQFSEDYALRVSVREDNYEPLYSLQKSKYEPENESDDEEIINLLKINLLNGFKIGQRKYMVLGSSTSHLREQGLMFYADKDDTGKPLALKDIYSELGNFEDIKCVPRYMARIGQFFSQALNAIHVDRSKTEEVADITIPRQNSDGQYKFSDGIGKISSELAKKVFEKLDILNEPSAMQIRYAGFKGMLTVWPDMKGEKIIFRKSMNKFPSNNESLEILKVSKPSEYNNLVYLT